MEKPTRIVNFPLSIKPTRIVNFSLSISVGKFFIVALNNAFQFLSTQP